MATGVKTTYDPNYNVSVRDTIKGLGVTDDRIRYDNPSGYVYVDNQQVYRPEANLGGRTFTNQAGRDAITSAVQGLMNQQQSPQATQPASQPQQWNANQLQQTIMNPTMPDNPYTEQLNQQIQSIMASMQNQQPYNPYASPQYAAYQAQAQRAANQGIRAAQESLGSAGFGRSTTLGERAQGVQNEANQYLETQVVPQLIAAEEARRQQQIQNMMAMLNPVMQQQGYADQRSQVERGNAFDALGYLSQEDQRAFDQNLAVADRTGTLMPHGAQPIINQILSLKQQAEAEGITAEQRNELSQRADELRSQLAGLGVDPSLFGADVGYSQAQGNVGGAGTPTLAGRDLEFGQSMAERQFDRSNFESDRQYEFAVAQQEWENNFRSEQFDWTRAQQAWENAFQERNFEQQMQEAAASRGLQWASLNQRDKEFIADMAFREKQFEYNRTLDEQARRDEARDRANASTRESREREAAAAQATRAENFYDMIDNSPFMSTSSSTDFESGEETRRTAVTDPRGLRNYIISLGLPDSETDKLLLRYGLPVN